MNSDGVYLRMIGIPKDPHWLPDFILDKFLLQEIAYQTHINGVSSSLIKVCKMENVKQAKEECSVLSSFKFIETSFRRHDHEGL